MRKSQRGVTFLGWLILLVPVGILVYTAIRLTPIYTNYMAVASSIEQLTDEFTAQEQINAQAVRVALEKRFDIEGITHPNVREIDIHREEGSWVIIANYEDVAPLFGNVSLLVQFNKQVTL
jgi:hypothetical protein